MVKVFTSTYIKELSLLDFRSYQKMSLSMGPDPIILTGKNGEGKTNLLEAITLLGPGKGMRGAPSKEILCSQNTNAVGWAVTSKIHNDARMTCIDTVCDGISTSSSRKVLIDGAPARSRDILQHLSVLWVSPAMSGLFTDGTTQRRLFFDRMVQGLNPEIASSYRVLDRVVKDRFRLLQRDTWDLHWINMLEHQIVESSVAIVAARHAYCEKLNNECTHTSANFPRFHVTPTGMLETWLETMPALQAEDKYADFLQQSRARDKELGGISYGPQRSDFQVQNLTNGQSAHLCSTGEQKALLISMILAHSRLVRVDQKRPPVLLLDEITAHLDDRRRDSLFEDIVKLELQVWMTGTDPENFRALDNKAQFFGIEDGTIKERQHGR